MRFEKTFRLPDSDSTPERHLAFIADALVAGWSPALEELSVSWGDQHGEYWVASCYLPDDTSVELRVDRATLQASLTVDPNPALKPLRGPPAWFNGFLLGALAFGAAVGLATSSWGWGIAAAVLPIAAQTARDMFFRNAPRSFEPWTPPRGSKSSNERWRASARELSGSREAERVYQLRGRGKPLTPP